MTTITNTHSGIDHLSYSAVSTFQRCPLKWHFRYVDKLPDESIGSALAFGSAIHAGLECHFRQLLESGTRAELADLILAYDDCWQSYDTELLKYGRGEDAESLRELGQSKEAIPEYAAARKLPGEYAGDALYREGFLNFQINLMI